MLWAVSAAVRCRLQTTRSVSPVTELVTLRSLLACAKFLFHEASTARPGEGDKSCAWPLHPAWQGLCTQSDVILAEASLSEVPGRRPNFGRRYSLLVRVRRPARACPAWLGCVV